MTLGKETNPFLFSTSFHFSEGEKCEHVILDEEEYVKSSLSGILAVQVTWGLTSHPAQIQQQQWNASAS